MIYKGRQIQRCLRELQRYVQKHVTHSHHLRPMIHTIKKKEWHDIIGVEIGTLHGLNALSMLYHLDIKHLYLIDPYILYDDGINTYKNRNNDFNIAQRNLKQYKDKVTIIKKTSQDAVNDVPDNVDFVYIDGNHSYRYVKNDIESYYPKVRNGGIIGGHDFRSDCEGLCRAVLEFLDKNDLQYQLQGWLTDWWIVKK